MVRFPVVIEPVAAGEEPVVRGPGLTIAGGGALLRAKGLGSFRVPWPTRK